MHHTVHDSYIEFAIFIYPFYVWYNTDIYAFLNQIYAPAIADGLQQRHLAYVIGLGSELDWSLDTD